MSGFLALHQQQVAAGTDPQTAAATLSAHAAQYKAEAATRDSAGKPDGELLLKANGQIISGWTGIHISRGVERIPGSFDVRGTARLPGELRQLVPLNSPTQLTIGGHVVITGYLERATSRLADTQHTLSFAGRGRCCDLVDCAAVISGMSRNVIQLPSFAAELVKPFAQGKIEIVAPDGGGANKPYTFTVNLGESPYDIIERIARFEGLLVYENADGNLVLSRVGTAKHNSGFVEGQNIQSIEVFQGMDGRFSEYIPQRMSSDVLTRSGQDIRTGGNSVGASIPDPGVNRYRPRIVISEQMVGDVSLATQRAIWEAARRAGRGFHIVVTVDSWLDSGGLPWTPNNIASISMPSLDIKQLDWIISDVTFRRDVNSGTTALITLMPPEALTVEPTAMQATDARAATPPPAPATGSPTPPVPPTSAPNAGRPTRPFVGPGTT